MSPAVTVLALTFATSLAVAQPATITGTIRDLDGGAVKDARVEAKNTATGEIVRVTSSAAGEYALRLTGGTYDLSIPMPCCQYGSFSQANLRLRTGESRRLDIRLPWGPNLGALGDDPILLLNEFRDRAPVASGPTPRTPEGRPDLTGIWINVYNPDAPPPPLQKWADQLLRERVANNSKDYPGAYCLPASASPITRAFPYKFIQAANVIVVLHESDTPGFRQIFLDGRKHPTDINPTWEGHSVGHWEGDTLVVDTSNYNDRSWLSLSGIPHSEKLHTVERIRRPDYGHLDVEITMDDADAFTGRWVRTFTATLAPAEDEITEFICNENNRDVGHYRDN
jgi:Carboxypeptidase regulatory-like domain